MPSPPKDEPLRRLFERFRRMKRIKRRPQRAITAHTPLATETPTICGFVRIGFPAGPATGVTDEEATVVDDVRDLPVADLVLGALDVEAVDGAVEKEETEVRRIFDVLPEMVEVGLGLEDIDDMVLSSLSVRDAEITLDVGVGKYCVAVRV